MEGAGVSLDNLVSVCWEKLQVELLLETGADKNWSNEYGETLLMRAAKNGYHGVIQASRHFGGVGTGSGRTELRG